MIVGTLFTLFVVPVFYTLIAADHAAIEQQDADDRAADWSGRGRDLSAVLSCWSRLLRLALSPLLEHCLRRGPMKTAFGTARRWMLTLCCALVATGCPRRGEQGA